MKYDPNKLERDAALAMKENRFRDALSIYYYMADGDPSLDGGYLGHKIGLCYEGLNYQQQAYYWFGRAVEENPEIDEYVDARNRLSDLDFSHIQK